MNRAIAVTTINKPSEALIKLSKLKDFKLFVAGDNKTPKDWQLDNSTFLSIDWQHKNYKKLSELVAENHYARKNFAYLEAIKNKIDYLYETDDDNIPYDRFPTLYERAASFDQISSDRFFNVYSLFTKKMSGPEGFP